MALSNNSIDKAALKRKISICASWWHKILAPSWKETAKLYQNVSFDRSLSKVNPHFSRAFSRIFPFIELPLLELNSLGKVQTRRHAVCSDLNGSATSQKAI
jgi:hypothetical protein